MAAFMTTYLVLSWAMLLSRERAGGRGSLNAQGNSDREELYPIYKKKPKAREINACARSHTDQGWADESQSNPSHPSSDALPTPLQSPATSSDPAFPPHQRPRIQPSIPHVLSILSP